VKRFVFTSTGLVYGSNGGPAYRICNVVDDEAPDLATLFASVGAPPPDGSNADAARPFDAFLDGRRIREDLGFRPQFPRLADAMAAGALSCR
jgi:UDP-glucose 4-epimerase